MRHRYLVKSPLRRAGATPYHPKKRPPLLFLRPVALELRFACNSGNMRPLLEFQNISVMRGSKTVLDNVTLRIQAGEHVAILGPNGCGKSTLIKTITRECYPLDRHGSSLSILGHDSWNVFDLRKLLGIVTNDLVATCTRDITGLEVVLSGFFSSIGIQPYHHVTRSMRQKALAVLDRLEIPHLADREMDAISSGESRRILIGRALVHDPLALLLDEPTNSLDLHATFELRAILR